MLKRDLKFKKSPLKSLEMLGKPILFLFTIFGVIVVTYWYLINNFIHIISSEISQLKFSFPPRHVVKTRRIRKSSDQIVIPKFLISIIILLIIVSAASAFSYWYFLKDLPSPQLLVDSRPSLSTKIFDRNGNLLYKIYKNENRSLIKLDEIPQYVIQATIAAEDKNFYHHHGLSLIGITRAIRNNISCYLSHITCNDSLQGGSTITQQLIKNTLLTPEKTLKRKLSEAVLALVTENLYTKEQILELYLNNIPYGGESYGIEAASQEFLGKSAKYLSLAEASLLAGLPVAPTTLSPFGTTPYMAKIRQQQVLESMVEEKFISENEKIAALNETIAFNPRAVEIKAPHFVMYIKSLLVSEFGEHMVERGGLEVTTTLDLSIQQELQTQIDKELGNLKTMKVGNAAGMVIKPDTGEVLAMIGSQDFFDTENDGQVNVVFMPRQPGSSIKPITYTLALMSGLKPESLINDSPICFVSHGSDDYCPNNYDGRFHGQVSLKTALASSYNIPAVKLLNTLGVMNMVNLGKSMGISTWDDSNRFGLSLTLGGGEVKMYDMAQVYSILAMGGEKVPLYTIESVLDSGGNLLIRNDHRPRTRVIPQDVAVNISSILADPVARAPAFGTHSILNLPGNSVSVKTGTTNNMRDNWTFGYTKELLVATWVGNNDNSPMSKVASGITGASPIWARTMKALLDKEIHENIAKSERTVTSL